MQITATNQTAYSDLNETQTKQNYKSNFSIKEQSPKDPSERTFEEYKNYSYEDLKMIYGDDQEALHEANFLKKASSYSKDDLLNEVMFDKAASLKTKEQQMDMTTFMFFSRGMDENGNFPIDFSFDEMGRVEIFKADENNALVLNANFNSHEEVLAFFNILSENFNKSFKKGQADNNTAQKEFSRAAALIVNDIKKDYEKRLNEKEELLNEITGTKPKNDELSDIQRLVDDLLSMLQTGLTVSEVEQLEKMLEEIQALLAKREESAVKSEFNEELEEKLSALEKFVAELQKRQSGEAVMEPSRKAGASGDDPSAFNERTKYLEKVIKKLKDSLVTNDAKTSVPSTTTQEELLMRQQYKQNENE